MKLDIKTLIFLIGLAVTFGGFYYGTEYRLSSLETQVDVMEEQNKDLSARIQKLAKRIKRIDK